MIGNKIIKIQGDNIVIGNEVYVGTRGLWTEKNPEEYDEGDYERYKELIYETNVLYCDYDPRSRYHRADRSTKWKMEGIVPDDEEEHHSTNLGDGFYRMYLQKNGRCFNLHRHSLGIHLTPRPLLAGILSLPSHGL